MSKTGAYSVHGLLFFVDRILHEMYVILLTFKIGNGILSNSKRKAGQKMMSRVGLFGNKTNRQTGLSLSCPYLIYILGI